MPLPRLFRAVPPVVAVLLVLAGCADQPDLESTISDSVRAAPYPDLVPLEPLLATSGPRRDKIDNPETDLAARRDRLQQRAQRLSGTVVDTDTRTRMRTGVAPLPGM